MDGIVLVDKPAGWTSFDVVAKVRGILKNNLANETRASDTIRRKRVKVGHTGTLDPLATGLLVLCIGNATKKVPMLTGLDKTYEAEIRLGASSTTDDAEGLITVRGLNLRPEPEQVLAVVAAHFGSQMQVPPRYSAIKVGGKRAYDLARKGRDVKLAPRRVTIYDIRHVRYEWPRLRFECDVSSGTYIRSLARDIGEALGMGGYLTSLRRTRVGAYSVKEAIPAEELCYSLLQDNVQ